MDEKVYESKRTVTLKDGTIREYKTIRRYTPKRKEVSKTEIYKRILQIEDIELLKKVKQLLDDYERDSSETGDKL